MNHDDLIEELLPVVREIGGYKQRGEPVPDRLMQRLTALHRLLSGQVSRFRDNPEMIDTMTRLDAMLTMLKLTTPVAAEETEEEDDDYAEIRRLHHLLEKADIPHRFQPHIAGGYHLVYYGHKGAPKPEPGRFLGPGVGAVCSAIQIPSNDDGLIEIQGLLTPQEAEHDSVANGLTAPDVFERIRRHWLEEGS